MFRTIREAREREEGFTLIELLVVVIIIGILAAIAIPTFLSQREKAWDSAAKSDLRNAATAQESYYTENSKYANSAESLADEGFNMGENITLTVDESDATGYCMSAYYDADDTAGADSGNTWYFSSDQGEPNDTGCASSTGTG